MERFFKFDKFNTFYDWGLILTDKEISPPEPKTYSVDIDGMDGSLDLSEALAGRVVYGDRTISATFWTDKGNRNERNNLLRSIRQSVHGRKMHIIEPDDPDHYFVGRVKIKNEVNNLAYAEISIECVCEPYRYSVEDTVRYVSFKKINAVNIVLSNNGTKIITPEITVTGSCTVYLGNASATIKDGTYKITELRLQRGFNNVNIYPNTDGSISFRYREADI